MWSCQLHFIIIIIIIIFKCIKMIKNWNFAFYIITYNILFCI